MMEKAMSSNPGFRVQREIYQSRLHLPDDPDAVRYRAISGLAVCGLLVGVLALGVLISPGFWAAAIAGLVLNALALKRIARYAPALLGRKAALAGLAFSVVAFVGMPAHWLVNRRLVRDEAGKVGAMWFDFLAHNQPQKAHQLTLPHGSRERLDGDLWGEYHKSSDAWMYLSEFLRRPEVRTLLALGDKATVRCYDTESQWSERSEDHVYQSYAVTYADSEGLKTFFVGLLLDRTVDQLTGHAYWQVARVEGGMKPKALGGDGEPPR